MQQTGEDSAFGRKSEAARSKHLFEHGAAAGLLPQSPEQQWRADAFAGEPIGIPGGKLREHDRALGVACH
jgi:hypothetical protein